MPNFASNDTSFQAPDTIVAIGKQLYCFCILVATRHRVQPVNNFATYVRRTKTIFLG